MKSLRFILLVAIGLSCTYGHAGGTVGNGGDGVAAEVVLTAQTAIELLKAADLSDIPEFKLNAFAGAVSTTVVHSEERLILNGNEVDAINYPEEKSLKVSRTRWMPLRDETRTVPRFLLVIHEYLWLSGLNDSNYRLSKLLIQKMSPSKFSTQKWWEPMNPTNMIGFTYQGAGCGESHSDWRIEFDLTKDEEDKVVLIDPNTCGSEKITVHVSKTTGYGGSTDGLVGKYHVFELSLTDTSGKNLGKLTYEPEWGRCLVTSDKYCSQSGNFHTGNVQFNFQMRK